MIYNGSLLTYTKAKAVRDDIQAECLRFSAIRQGFPQTAIGLTPDAVKTLPEWQMANRDYARAFARLRRFDRGFTKAFKHEITAERAAKYREWSVVDR
jgi:hypothetical protein